MSNKLYIGNLNFTVTEAQLTQLFSEAGTVSSIKLIIDHAAGKSKGFGFIEMSSAEEAEKAIQSFNETEFEGRKLIVNEARPQKPRY